MRSVVVLLSAIWISAAAEEIILSSTVRIAFYEAAPHLLEVSMKRAVTQFCRAQPGAKAEKNQWLCSGIPLRFLRSVDVLGNRQKIGLACASSSVTPNLMYYTPDMFLDESGCAPLSYSVAAKTHEVEPNE